MTIHNPTRRALAQAGAFGALALLSGCGTPLPLTGRPPASQPDAERLLQQSAQAHGLDAYRGVRDLNVRYEGQWRPLVDRVQPTLIDKPYRGGSEERLMPATGLVAQNHVGPAGRKQVVWQRGQAGGGDPGNVQVWRNGAPDQDAQSLSAAALVAEGYALFLLGPMWLVGRGLAVQADSTELVDERLCSRLQLWLQPGLGQVALDRLTLCIDPSSRLVRRMRFTLEGHLNTQGAVAQVDMSDHRPLHGMTLPTRFYEEVVHPLRLPAHDWWLTGLDINRGYDRTAIAGPAFTGAAAAAARAL